MFRALYMALYEGRGPLWMIISETKRFNMRESKAPIYPPTPLLQLCCNATSKNARRYHQKLYARVAHLWGNGISRSESVGTSEQKQHKYGKCPHTALQI